MLCDRIYAVGAPTSSKTNFQWRSNEMDRLSFLLFPFGIFHLKIFGFLNSGGLPHTGEFWEI